MPRRSSARTRFEFRQVERLGQVVVGAQIEPTHAVGQRVQRGTHQYRHLRLARAQAAQHVQPAEAGQADVQNHQVVAVRDERAVGLLTGGTNIHGIGGLDERA